MMSCSKYTHFHEFSCHWVRICVFSRFLFLSSLCVHRSLSKKKIFILTMDPVLASCLHIRIRTTDLQRMRIFSGFSMYSWASPALFLFIQFCSSIQFSDYFAFVDAIHTENVWVCYILSYVFFGLLPSINSRLSRYRRFLGIFLYALSIHPFI